MRASTGSCHTVNGRFTEFFKTDNCFTATDGILKAALYSDAKSKKEEESTATNPTKDEEKACNWPLGLITEELPHLAELGLGKAIDATLKHPWANKKAYQAREVKREEDLLVTNEGSRYESFHEYVETHYEVQGTIETAVKVPSKPIDASVAADLHRSHTHAQRISGKNITTRTISYKMNCLSNEVSSVDNPTPLETSLDTWVESKGGKKDGAYSSETNSYCRDFLIDILGGATHYVSSITLGAMTYETEIASSTTNRTSMHLKVNIPRGGALKSSVRALTTSAHKQEKSEMIGIFPKENEEKIIPLRTPSEAVIRYAFTPLTALIANRDLRKYLQEAIQQYIESFKRRGPFHILSAEPTTKGRVYWKLECEKEDMKFSYKVVGTTNDEMASNFYIRPDPTDSSRKGFFITTDPEDTRHCPKPKAVDGSKGTDDSGQHDIEPLESEDSGHKTGEEAKTQKDLPDVECYLHIEEAPVGSECRIVPRSLVDGKKAQMKLVNRVNRKDIRLLDSNWLPQTQGYGGEPYFVRPTYHSSQYIHKPCIAMVDINHTWPQIISRTWRRRIPLLRGNRHPSASSDSDPTFITVLKRKSEEHDLNSHLMVFMLTKGHPT